MEGKKARAEEGDGSLRPSPIRTFSPSSLVRPLALVAAVVLAAALLANSMMKEVGRDEQMYCTAGVLLSHGQLIYRDFPYISHPPCHALLLAGLYQVVPTEHYLLVGRLASVACGILVLLAILGVYRSLFGKGSAAGLAFGLAAAGLCTFNPVVDSASGYAWNHDLVIACVLLALWLFVTTDFQSRSRFWRTALMGALLAFATGARITTGLAALPFLVALAVATPGGAKTRIVSVLVFAAAAGAVLLGPLWIFLQAPHAMWLDLTRIPVLCARWLQEKGFLYDKRQLSLVLLTTPGYLVLLFLAGYLGSSLIRRWRSALPRDRLNAALAASLAILFFVIAYLPPAMWEQYLAVPVPFAVAALAFPLALLHRQAGATGKKGPFRVAAGLMAVGTGVALLANPVVLDRSWCVFVPEQWVPVRVHRLCREMAGRMAEPRRVLTLGPLYALEGGGAIYPELANPFTCRVADRLSAEERALTHTVGLASLKNAVQDRPPSAVLVGVEPSYLSFLEDSLRREIPPNWPRETYGGTLQVYRRP